VQFQKRKTIDVTLWGCSDHVNQLTHLRLKLLEQMHVIRLLPEMLLEQVMDRPFEHERIVDRNVAHAFHAPRRMIE